MFDSNPHFMACMAVGMTSCSVLKFEVFGDTTNDLEPAHSSWSHAGKLSRLAQTHPDATTAAGEPCIRMLQPGFARFE